MDRRSLITLLLLLFCSSAYANVPSTTPYISGADVTITALNNNQNAIVSAMSNIEGNGVNIKNGTINTIDLSQAVSPITRWGEAFNDFTYSGHLPATDSDLSSDISAGVSYVNGYRIQTAATAHSYTASKDTFVYLNEGGYFIYCEEPNGASACGVPPTNSLLLAEVVTNGTLISSVNDLRTLSIQITTTTTNFPADFRNQAYVSRDTTTAVHVEPGSVAIGTTIYTRLTDSSSKEIATATNWIEGVKPFSEGKIYIYAYNDAGSTFDFKFSSADPVYSDTDDNTAGVKRYYATGGTDYRAIGWAYMSADLIQTYAIGNFSDIGVPNKVVRQFSTYASLGAGNIVVDNTPALVTEGNPIPLMDIHFVPSNPNATIKVTAKANISTSSTNNISLLSLYKDAGTSSVKSSAELTTTDFPIPVDLVYFVTAGDIAARRYSFRTGSLGGRDSYINGISGTGALFGNTNLSSVEIEEIQS